jgi:agmatine deiminase
MMTIRTPKQLGFRMPAEWHPHERCFMAWPSHQKTWASIGLERARHAYAQVAKAIVRYEPVSMLVNPDDEKEAARLCGHDIQLLPMLLDDSWTRDTGPSFLIQSERKILAGVDWIHNAWGGNYEGYAHDQEIAGNLITMTNAKHFKAPLVMEGGAFHVDGEGTILTTRECLLNPNRNPTLNEQQIEQYLCDYLGGEKVIWLNKGFIDDETNGHIDEIACFIAPGKVLCLMTGNPEDPNAKILQENLDLLRHETDAKGRALEIHTVEQLPPTFLNERRLSLSYINFYLANHGIVMPAFGVDHYDRAAYRCFSELFPHHEITQIDAKDVFIGGGGIHCITQQQPKIL